MRILIIGAGSIGKRHARNLRQLRPGVTVITVDPLAPADYRGYEFALEQGRYDAAIIASPMTNHIEHMLELGERRIHFLTEKPLALRSLTARSAVNAATDLRCAVMPLNVLLAHRECRFGDFAKVHLGVQKIMRGRNADTAAACAKIKNA